MPFAEPRALLLLLLVPLLGILMGLVRWRRRLLLRRLGREDLVATLVEAPGALRWLVRGALLLAGAAFLSLALARPQWGSKIEEVRRRGVDVMIALDVSNSMLAEDVKPSRLVRAREEVASLIDALEGDRVGLVAFAGEATVACPLTLDYSAVKVFLDVLDPDLVPVQGTAVAAAIRKSTEAFESQEKRYKVLVVITDGEDHEGEALEAAREAAAQGVVIYTLGAGTGAGAPIPVRQGAAVTGFKQDRQGRIVTSRLDPVGLAEIAEAAGGRYLPLTPEGREIREIQDRIAHMDQREIGSRFITTREERYQLPLAAALGALILEAGIGGRLLRRRRSGP